ncbi:MAG: endolytic transglycosylase MltG [Bacteroidota bacterium]
MIGGRRSGLWITLGAVVLVGAAGFFLSDLFYGANGPDGEERMITVSRGSGFSRVADSLEKAGLIRSRAGFVFVARIRGGTERIRVGRYRFSRRMSNTDIFLSLREGRNVVRLPVTLPEGLRSRAQARILSRVLGADSAAFVRLVSDSSFAASLGVTAGSLEGYLMPETYFFDWQPDEREVASRLVREFTRFFTDSLAARARGFGWSVHQAITMASLVEGEASLPEERGLVAGVYHNRLRKGMRLQADPSVQFMFEEGPRRVLYADLKRDHPYNTYMRRGLPPGPVNNPGREAIRAALWPARHSYLYFVADGRGGHRFSTTYTEHRKNVSRYRAGRRKAAEAALTKSGQG